ncbi:MAG: hypothetical protein OXU66_16180 [Gammaproteobacteria bacterium]|nr:hypothetical protein [Gammaproteobacteria bacterium]MDD9896383.1 hypothetical protein [Gammaproteobacteria bacterium]MDD9960455.1 hypothetical protein [Gammaproteobacteria bacterium]
MSEEKPFDKRLDNDPERTLITLEQLSQTIEVMTSVVNRLRQHLSEQLRAQIEAQEQAKLEEAKLQEQAQSVAEADNSGDEKKADSKQQQNQRESFVVEIRQQENDPVRKNTKTLH